MKHIYIMRHAKASGTVFPDLNDFERPLLEEGEKDAKWIGERLSEIWTTSQYLIISSAQRAQMTAFQVLKAFPLHQSICHTDERLYNANLQALLNVLSETPNEYSDAVLIAHNPGVTQLVQYLTGLTTFSMPPGSVYGIELPVENWNLMKIKHAEFFLFLSPLLRPDGL